MFMFALSHVTTTYNLTEGDLFHAQQHFLRSPMMTVPVKSQGEKQTNTSTYVPCIGRRCLCRSAEKMEHMCMTHIRALAK